MADPSTSNEDECRLPLDPASNPVIVVNTADGSIIAFNDLFCDVLGYDRERLAGLHLKDIQVPSSELPDLPNRQNGKGAFRLHDVVLRSSTGEPRHFRKLSGYATDGDHIESSHFLIDVTEQGNDLSEIGYSERYYRNLFENAHDAILVFRPEDEVILDVNHRCCEIYGFERSELIGMSLVSISADVEKGKTYIAETTSRETFKGFETVQYRKDGTPMHLEVNASMIQYKGQKAILSINRDITRRKLDERQIRQSKMRYDLATAAAGVGVWDWNLETGEFYLDRNVKALLGYSDEEIPNDIDIWSQYVHPDDRDFVMKAATDHLEGRTDEYICEHRMLHKDGGHRWFMVRGHAIRDSSGKAVRMAGTDTDVTDRRNAELALQASEKWHRALIDRGASVYAVIDRSGEVLFESSTIERFFGWKPEDIVGSNVFEMVHPEDRQMARQRFRELLEAPGRELSDDFRYRHKNGSWRAIHVTGINLLHDPTMKGIVLTTLDVTERKRLEQERMKLESRIQHAQKLESLSIMAGGVAHDFNNLLTGILGNASLLRTELSPSSPMRIHLERIESSALRASELTNQLLAYSGKSNLVITAVDLSELVDDTIHLMETTISKNASLKVSLGKPIPAVMADATQIQQVAMNLVTNASEALDGRKGMIWVRTDHVTVEPGFFHDAVPQIERPASSYVFLEVSDTGSGMDEDTSSKVFEPFFSTKFTGRGLGLAAVLGIVSSHGGAIKIDSEPGSGTIITVFFPATDKKADKLSARPEASDRWTGSGTVLVIDDESSVRSVAESILVSRGFDVLTAVDGQEGLEVFRREHSRLTAVLLDLTMPRMDGKQTFPALHEIDPAVPVILMSGYDQQEVVRKFTGAALAGFLKKPYTSNDLVQKLREVLDDTINKPEH